jgi:hypothetical protein
LKISAAVLVLLAMMSRPCAAAPEGGGSFLDHAVSPSLYHGAFSSVGSFRSGLAQGTDFGTLHAVAAPRSERQTGAMLLASLGLLVLIARRRRRALSAAD